MKAVNALMCVLYDAFASTPVVFRDVVARQVLVAFIYSLAVLALTFYRLHPLALIALGTTFFTMDILKVTKDIIIVFS